MSPTWRCLLFFVEAHSQNLQTLSNNKKTVDLLYVRIGILRFLLMLLRIELWSWIFLQNSIQNDTWSQLIQYFFETQWIELIFWTKTMELFVLVVVTILFVEEVKILWKRTLMIFDKVFFFFEKYNNIGVF